MWCSLFIFIFLTCLLVLEREGKGEGEKEKEVDVREKHRLVASHTRHNWGLNPQPRYVPWPGIEPPTFWCTGWCSNQLSHTSQGRWSLSKGHWRLVRREAPPRVWVGVQLRRVCKSFCFKFFWFSYWKGKQQIPNFPWSTVSPVTNLTFNQENILGESQRTPACLAPQELRALWEFLARGSHGSRGY